MVKFLMIPSLMLLLSFSEAERSSPSSQPGVSYSRDIRPLIQDRCAVEGCHNGTIQPDLREYQVVKFMRKRIQKRITDENQPMPPLDAEQTLTPAERAKIIMWIQAGVPNN